MLKSVPNINLTKKSFHCAPKKWFDWTLYHSFTFTFNRGETKYFWGVVIFYMFLSVISGNWLEIFNSSIFVLLFPFFGKFDIFHGKVGAVRIRITQFATLTLAIMIWTSHTLSIPRILPQPFIVAFGISNKKLIETLTCTASEVENKMILMGHPISCCHAPVIRSFFIHCKMIISP